MKRNCIIGCAALLLTLCGVSATAQGRNNELMRDWDVRMGFFIPERGGARAQEGDVWFTLGVDRTVFSQDRLKATMSVDYYGSGSLYNVPVLLNLRHETHKFRLFAGAGIGVSHDMSEGKTGFAYNVGGGYALSQAIMFDARYMGLSTGGGALNGWAFTFGYHF